MGGEVPTKPEPITVGKEITEMLETDLRAEEEAIGPTEGTWRSPRMGS